MSDALSATAGSLARRALLVLPADGPRGRADIARLPAPLGRLLAARLDRAVETAAPSSPWIDHTDDRVREATDAWREAARAAAQFPTDEWESALEAAASQALDHLIKPAETIANATVPEGSVPIETAIARGRRFGAYPYLLEVAARYAQRKEIGQVDRQTFFQLLDRIDRRMVKPFGADEWVTLLNPLFSLIGPVGGDAGTVPSAVLRTALEARGATALADAIGTGDLSESDFRAALEDALSGTTTSDLEDAAPPPSDGPPPAPEPAADVSAADAPAAPRIATEPPSLTPRPLPPIADETVSPIVGSRFGTPEVDDLEDSGVVGPPRPVTRPAADPPTGLENALEDPFRPAPSSTPPAAKPAAALEGEPIRKPSPLDQILGLTPSKGVGNAGTASKDEPLWKRLAREREASAPGPSSTPAPPSPASPPPSASAPAEDIPLWKRFAQSDLANRLPPPETEDMVAETIPPEDVSIEDEAPPRPGPVLEDETPTQPDASPADDLEVRVLGPDAADRRSWYVTELFGGNQADYRATLEAIDGVKSYTDATTVVSKEVLVKNSVSPFSDAAIAFIDAVQFQFGKRGGGV